MWVVRLRKLDSSVVASAASAALWFGSEKDAARAPEAAAALSTAFSAMEYE